MVAAMAAGVKVVVLKDLATAAAVEAWMTVRKAVAASVEEALVAGTEVEVTAAATQVVAMVAEDCRLTATAMAAVAMAMATVAATTVVAMVAAAMSEEEAAME